MRLPIFTHIDYIQKIVEKVITFGGNIERTGFMKGWIALLAEKIEIRIEFSLAFSQRRLMKITGLADKA